MKETGEVKGKEGRGWIVRVGANESQTDSQIQWSLGRALCRGTLHTAALQPYSDFATPLYWQRHPKHVWRQIHVTHARTHAHTQFKLVI